MAVAGRKWLWKRTTLPVPEGWIFVTARRRADGRRRRDRRRRHVTDPEAR